MGFPKIYLLLFNNLQYAFYTYLIFTGGVQKCQIFFLLAGEDMHPVYEVILGHGFLRLGFGEAIGNDISHVLGST